MTYMKKLSTLCLTVLIMSCSLQKEGVPKIKQGIYGSVTWLEGNMMPSPDAPKASNGGPVVRTLNIYEVVTFKEVEGQAPLFTAIKGKLVKTVKSNSKGLYECELPVGTYSVFTVEPEGNFFANNFDGNEQINAIKIEQGITVKLDMQINYKAAY